MIAALIRELNRKSPHLWEVKMDGFTYTILCEDSVFEDEESCERLMDLDEESCKAWLKELIRTV